MSELVEIWMIRYKGDKKFNKRLDKAMESIRRYKITSPDSALSVLKYYEIDCGFSIPEHKDKKVKYYLKIPFYL